MKSTADLWNISLLLYCCRLKFPSSESSMSACLINPSPGSDHHHDDHTPALRDLKEDVIDLRSGRFAWRKYIIPLFLYPSLFMSKGN